jgi:2-polyprenyl-3-methyl-5-hydroxy-6-metoxy-1,4-benzoquinol methylase
MSKEQTQAVKANVQAFDRDAREHGGYRYTGTDRLSKRFSNSRSTRAIAEAADLAGSTIIDIGCGDGTFTIELAGCGALHVLGIEPAAGAVERATTAARADERGLTNISFEVGNVYDLRTDLPPADYAVMRGVLHHLPDPAQAVAAISRHCKRLVILEPNGMNPVLKIIERVSRYHIDHEEQSFLPTTIDRWVTAANGIIEYRKFLNFVPLFSPDMIARTLKLVEPLVEATPGIRVFSTGQYLLRARFD